MAPMYKRKRRVAETDLKSAPKTRKSESAAGNVGSVNYDDLTHAALDALLQSRALQPHKLKWGKIQRLHDDDRKKRLSSPHNLPRTKPARRIAGAIQHRTASTKSRRDQLQTSVMPSSSAPGMLNDGQDPNPEQVRDLLHGRISQLTMGQIVAMHLQLDDWRVGLPSIAGEGGDQVGTVDEEIQTSGESEERAVRGDEVWAELDSSRMGQDVIAEEPETENVEDSIETGFEGGVEGLVGGSTGINPNPSPGNPFTTRARHKTRSPITIPPPETQDAKGINLKRCQHPSSPDRYDKMGSIELRVEAKLRKVNFHKAKLKSADLRATFRQMDTNKLATSQVADKNNSMGSPKTAAQTKTIRSIRAATYDAPLQAQKAKRRASTQPASASVVELPQQNHIQNTRIANREASVQAELRTRNGSSAIMGNPPPKATSVSQSSPGPSRSCQSSGNVSYAGGSYKGLTYVTEIRAECKRRGISVWLKSKSELIVLLNDDDAKQGVEKG